MKHKQIIKGLLIVALALTTLGAVAQENGNRDDQNKVVRGPYETNRFFDNIFIGVAGGINIYKGENDSYGSFGKRIAPAIDVHVGKWITPSVGLRVGYSGIQAKGWNYGPSLYSKGAANSSGFTLVAAAGVLRRTPATATGVCAFLAV